jgi:hypothetical protein
LIFDFNAILSRCAPEKWTRSLAYRPSNDLPFNAAAVPRAPRSRWTPPSTSISGALPPPIIETLERVPPQMFLVPSDEVWIEAADPRRHSRTRGVAKADRRRLLDDTLLFLTAAESGAILISRNLKDLDLLLQMKPGVGVVLYR